MLARVRTVWEIIGSSLWFIPGIFIIGAAALAWGAVSIELDVTGAGGAVWWLHSGSAAQAFDLLSSLLTSVITMATLAVSITMVVLTLAAGQLGPRLIRRFMADKYTQLILGFFLATIVYLLLVLRLVNDNADEASIPQVAVTLGSPLMLVCVFLLLLFVHHLARSIIADTVIQRVGDDLDAAFAAMLPEADEASAKAVEATPPPAGAALLRMPRGGYVQAIDYSGLVTCARDAGAVIIFDFRPGHHLLPNGTHGKIIPASAFSEDLRMKVAAHVVIGRHRTAAHDMEFAIRQLVEVAVRALSPGINDPFTAIAVIDRLGLSLASAMQRGAARGVWCDDEGTARVSSKSTTFNGMLDAAFNQIRQAGSGHPAVLIRVLATLAHLAELVRHEDHRQALATHVALVESEGERSIAASYDLDSLKEQSAAARGRLLQRG